MIKKWGVGILLAKFFLDISFFPFCYQCAAAVLRRRFFGDSDDAKSLYGNKEKQRRENSVKLRRMELERRGVHRSKK